MDISPTNGAPQEGPPPVQDDAAEREPLAGSFAAVGYDQWEQAVRAKEKDPQHALVTRLEEGITTNWLYSAADAVALDPGGLPGTAPFVRGIRTGSPWAIRQPSAAPDRRQANAQILEELEGGATEILLSIDPSGAAGVPVSDVDQLDEVLDGVYLDLAPVALEGDPAAADLLLELFRRRDHAAEELRGSLGLDPVGSGVISLDDAIATVTAVRDEFPRVRVLAVDTTPYADAGAGGVLELALALSSGVTYLRAGEAAGIDPDAIAATLEFTVAVGPDQFLEIARLRALRRLWSTVLEHCGVVPEQRASRLYARTSRRMYSSLDPWVNLLRGTTAAFAAAVGGADGITVLPFDEPYGTGITAPGPLGRRIARNTQLLLSEESSLHRVADPAGGSWYVESLTDQLAHAAWKQFQAIEADGGIAELLGNASLAAKLTELTAERHAAIARRERSLTGVNQFPLLGDDGVPRDAAATSPARPAGDGGTTPGLVRDAAQFEALRERAAKMKDARILLAATGPLSAHVTVVQWAKSFFEAGGVETVSQTEDDLAPEGFIAAAVCVGRDSDPTGVLDKLTGAGIEVLYALGGSVEGAERVRDGVDMVAVLSALLDHFEEAT